MIHEESGENGRRMGLLKPRTTGTLGASATVMSAPTVDRIAAARDEDEVFRRGVTSLTETLAPARCLVFDRDDYGQIRLAYHWAAPGAAEPATGPLELADQVQSWWMGQLQSAGVPQHLRPAPLAGRAATFVLPLLAHGLLHGMVVLQDCDRPLDAAAEREVIAIVTVMSLTLHSLVLRAQLAGAILPEQVEEAITQERRRIAREIHDGVAQSLAYLLLKTELLDRLVERDPVGAREQAGVLRQMLQQAVGELRRCIGDLRRPASGQGTAMTAQLRSLANTLGEMPNLELALQQVSGARLAPEVEKAVIGIVREALQNIRKHADAESVRVEVQREDGRLRVQVIDDGNGFQPGEPHLGPDQHFGMEQMRELAQEMGGNLMVDSHPGAGTRVEALIPLPPARPARR